MENNAEKVKQSKLLSIVLTGRNDDYMGNFKYRIITSINYLASNLKVLGRLDDVEILVSDWNSDVPLSKVLALTPEAARICRFVYVPPKVALEKQQPDQVFNIPCAINVSLRRAQGKFSMFMPADILFPTRSLRNLLELLSGEFALPFKLESCLFLASLKIIPWDIVIHEPSIDEWDQYLLLNSGELERPQGRWPGLGLTTLTVMHSSLWHACHGLDEQLSYWGWTEAELTLRISQYYPWMELSGFGVVPFDMQHRMQNRRVLQPPKTNPPIVHLSFAVNDDNWGLGDYELDIQMAENICKLPEAGKPSGRLSSNKIWNKTGSELLVELTSQEVKEHLLSTIQSWRSINLAEWESLCALTWYSLYCFPCRYLDFGICNEKAAAVVAAACPSIEIYGIDSWQAMNNDPALSPASVTGLLHSLGYRGYLRLVTGDPHTAFRRLRDSFVEPFSLDLALVRGDIFGSGVIQQLSDLFPHLAPGGMLVFACASADSFQRVWSELRAKFTQFSYLQCKSGKTGIILAASLQNDDLNTVSDAENMLRVDFGKPPRPGMGQSRVYRALRNPTKYPVYAKQICRFLFGRG